MLLQAKSRKEESLVWAKSRYDDSLMPYWLSKQNLVHFWLKQTQQSIYKIPVHSIITLPLELIQKLQRDALLLGFWTQTNLEKFWTAKVGIVNTVKVKFYALTPGLTAFRWTCRKYSEGIIQHKITFRSKLCF